MSTPHRRSARLASATLAKDNAIGKPQLGSVTEHQHVDSETVAPTPLARKKQDVEGHESHTPRLSAAKTPSKSAASSDEVTSQAPARTPQTPRTITLAQTSQDKSLVNQTQSCTPKASTIEPKKHQMHPGWAHVGKDTKLLSPGTEMGFRDINAENKTSLLNTPSKVNLHPLSAAIQSAMTPEARKLYAETQKKIEAEVVAYREANAGKAYTFAGRQIAQPRGRFDVAHAAEFAKMDSIADHPSAWRATQGRDTPTKKDLKPSPSKASLTNAASPAARMQLKRSPSKISLHSHASSQSLNKATLPSTSGKKRRLSVDIQEDAKRPKRLQHDDVSKTRPVVQAQPGEAAQPARRIRTPSRMSRLASPTKSSLPHVSTPNKPTVTLVNSPSRALSMQVKKTSTLPRMISTPQTEGSKRRFGSHRMEKFKLLFRGNSADSAGKRTDEDVESNPLSTSIPMPKLKNGDSKLVSQTPGPLRAEKALPPAPLTTPGQRFSKHVSFATEEPSDTTARLLAPSLHRSRSTKLVSALKDARKKSHLSLDGVLSQSAESDVVYPDLTKFGDTVMGQHIAESSPPSSVAGTFSFRTDHTICFDQAPSTGFGSSPGQASVRHIRGSLLPVKPEEMPGTFPAPPTPTSHPNKENKAPAIASKVLSVPHGLSNKKRHRDTSDDEDEQAPGTPSKRPQKKLKQDHGLGGRVIRAATSPSKSVISPQKPWAQKSRSPIKSLAQGMTVGAVGLNSPNQSKKRAPVLSASRLAALARPKHSTSR